MIKHYSLLLFSIFCLLSVPACSNKESRESMLEIEDFKNKWLVINYWASWCKPCIKEIPELNKLHRFRDEISVVGVNYDGLSGEELAKESSKLGIEFPNLAADPSSKLGTARPIVLPTTMIVDEKYKLYDTLIGPQTLETISFSITKSLGSLSKEEPSKPLSP